MAAVYAGRVSQVGSPQRRAQQPAEKGAAALAADAALAVEAAEAAEAGGSGGSEGGEAAYSTHIRIRNAGSNTCVRPAHHALIRCGAPRILSMGLPPAGALLGSDISQERL